MTMRPAAVTVDSIAPIATGCGTLRELLGRPVAEDISIAFCQNDAPSEKHYHAVMKEFYFFIKGSGVIIVGDEKFAIAPGVLVTIPPGTVHWVEPDEPVEFLAMNTPAYMADDYLKVDA
jgi:mannose-6-phosphate isomerase-like protein (cupin superfamily)